MNTITFEDKQKISLEIPSCWDDLTSMQFLEVVKFMPQILAEIFPDKLLLTLLGIDEKLFTKIKPIPKYHIRQTFNFLKEKPELKKLLVQSFTVNNIEFVGYMPAFSNTTWEEFIYADQYFMNNQYINAIAVLYREQKENHDGQSDIRIPFSIYGTSKRLEQIQTLDSNTVASIALNYQTLREKHIAQEYTHIFSFSSAEDTSDNSFSWLNVHRNILSEYFFEEEKFMKSNVHTVLHRMNNIIEENKKKKK
jgi:hypothetical protein